MITYRPIKALVAVEILIQFLLLLSLILVCTLVGVYQNNTGLYSPPVFSILIIYLISGPVFYIPSILLRQIYLTFISTKPRKNKVLIFFITLAILNILLTIAYTWFTHPDIKGWELIE